MISKKLKIQRWPSKSQWWQFLKSPHQILNWGEKIAFFSFLFLALASATFLLVNFYFENTKIVPASGGKFVEGVVGYPRFINPIYAEASDVDRDLTELIFSGLMKYNSEAEIVPDLAKDYKILEAGRVCEFEIREDAFWQDGEKVKTDDVVFTIKTIQNPEIKSPLLPNWLGVEVEKIDEQRLRFKLKEPYGPFLERMVVKIIPEHLWKDVLAKNFPLVNLNLMPVGSGPYQLKDLERDERGEIYSLKLVLNKKYFGKLPSITQISFKFFVSEGELTESLNSGKIDGADINQLFKNAQFDARWNCYHFLLPRYFAVFFNLKNEKAKALLEKEVRKALSYGTNKKEILEKVLRGQGQIVNSPLLPEIYQLKPASTTYEFDLEKAKEILEKAGYLEREGKRVKIIKKEPAFQFKEDLKLGSKGKEVEELQKCLARDKEIYPLAKIDGNFDTLTKKAVVRFQEKYKEEISKIVGYPISINGFVGKGTRAKLNEICFQPEIEEIPLKFSLATVDQPMLKETAFLLKKQWENLGAEVEVETFDFKDLEREILKPRDYQAILFGYVLGKIPDPFPFWHSSQREFGSNLAEYKNKKADELLEEGRTELTPEVRKEKYEELQEIIIEDAPAIFLYNPDKAYFVSKEIRGIKEGLIVDPSKRFSGIENWYIKTKRVWK
jgi:ABC-type transport system substrate-binding protein